MLQLQIETTTYCNAKCVFCLYPQMKRPKGIMSMELFQKVIDEAKLTPLISMLTLTGLGETLLDPHLIQRLKYVRKSMNGIDLNLFTNGTYLVERLAKKLVKYDPLVYVSLNAANASKREQIMKLDDYDQVSVQIEKARTMGLRCCVKAVAGKDLMESQEKEDFSKKWGEDHNLHLEGNWAGHTYRMRVKPVESCTRALTQIMVLWDGRVAICCFDGEGEYILGDLNKQTLHEMYASEKAVEFRTAHYEGHRKDLPLCRNCSMI